MRYPFKEQGHLRRRQHGREVIYVPRQAKDKAGRHALEQVLETFFGGSLEEALAAHLHARKDHVSADERERLIALIQQAQQEGRRDELLDTSCDGTAQRVESVADGFRCQSYSDAATAASAAEWADSSPEPMVVETSGATARSAAPGPRRRR